MRFIALPAVVLLFAIPIQTAGAGEQTDWPRFRGPHGRGVAADPSVPTRWDADTGRNVAWKTPIPGLAHSSPVVWGDRVFVTTAVRRGGERELKVGLYGDIAPVKDDAVHRFEVYGLSKKTGKVLWKRIAYEGVPKIKRHTKSSHANPTPAVDGKRVVAFFGSEGLYAYDLNGRSLWKKDLGVLDSGFYMVPAAQWGFGSSPILHDGKVIVQCDVIKNSFLAAFDAATGEEIWRTPRDDFPTWSTPTVIDTPHGPQVVVNGYKHIGGYDLKTGKEVWKLHGGGDIPVPTPFTAHDLIFITNSHGMSSPIYAVRTSAKGDVSLSGEATSNAQIAWSTTRDGAYMPTPLVVGDLLFVVRDNGSIYAYRAKTGERLYRERLGGGSGYTASPVAAGKRIYVTSETGDVHVVRASETFQKLADNSLGEIAMATPAISEGMLIFRTRDHVIAIAGEGDEEPRSGRRSGAGAGTGGG